ncbi:MAG: patatin-like phospholipase family protein [Proteobacteria bacterium]|nr:patatin-like phospholipase family protein [Pseudomonadota bacterium]
MMDKDAPFSSVVFAGGGSRCLWQVGFWDSVAPALELAPRAVAGVSAGATMACAILAGRARFALEYMKAAVAANPKNMYPLRLFSGRPVFPHYPIYRQAVVDVIDADGLERLRQGPDMRVLLARPPAWAGPRLAVLLGFGAYMAEKKLNGRVHPEIAARIGFRPLAVPVRACWTPEELADLLISSSCTPPMTPVMNWNGGPVLDGGLVDNVPVRALDPDDGPALVLLTRLYRPELLPQSPTRRYVQPSRPISVAKWDYTNPQGFQDAYDLGRRDGERFAAAWPD